VRNIGASSAKDEVAGMDDRHRAGADGPGVAQVQIAIDGLVQRTGTIIRVPFPLTVNP
jgi:hypothetical protein